MLEMPVKQITEAQKESSNGGDHNGHKTVREVRSRHSEAVGRKFVEK
jgi:hypothetical protein